MHANLIKYQVENCLALPGQNLISTCNRRVKSVSAGWVEIHPGKPGSCNHHLILTIGIIRKEATDVEFQRISPTK